MTLSRYFCEGLSGRFAGNSSRGTGRIPFLLMVGGRSGWYELGTSTKAGDSGGTICCLDEVLKSFARGKVVNRMRHERQMELDKDSIFRACVK